MSGPRATRMNHEAEVAGIGVGSGPDGEEVPAVVLRARGEYLPIFVTPDQARSIRDALSGEPFDRPLTHDLLVEMVTEFGGAIDSVRIDDITGGTFYGKLTAERYIDGEPDQFVFDARPSDAIAVAVREIGGVIEMPVLDVVSLAIIVGAAMLVSGAVVVSSIRELRAQGPRPTGQTAD